MGGGYSDLNIYIKEKKRDYNNNGYKVSIAKNNFDLCSSFVVFTHNIEYTPSDGRKYNVLLYDGYQNKKGEYLFGYYYPNDNEVIEKVQVYFSVLSLDDPLVISFTTKGQQTYNCLPRVLKNAGWNRAYNISEYSIKIHLSKDLLDKEFKKRSRNRKIQFTTNSDNKDVTGYSQNIADDKKMYRYIFIPKGDKSVLGLNCLFEIDNDKKEPKSSSEKIQIDQYYLQKVNGRFFDGIMVYFADENGGKKNQSEKKCAILIEFYNSTKDKISFKRIDNKGARWSQVKVDCNEDKKLIEKLKEIDRSVKSDKSVTVILDKNVNYLGAKVTSEGGHKACKKYCYKFDEANKPVFLLASQTKQIGKLDGNSKADNVHVYYLNVKDVQDKEPFVIVLFSSKERVPKQKYAYHFVNEYGFEKWELFTFKDSKSQQNLEDKQLEKKLEEKLEKIDEFASCIPVLSLLRWYAYQILIGKEPTDKEIKEEAAAKRPQVIKPPDKDEGLPINWIIGGSVGGGVFVISSAALYGVYWYNTTIKLLT